MECRRRGAISVGHCENLLRLYRSEPTHGLYIGATNDLNGRKPKRLFSTMSFRNWRVALLIHYTLKIYLRTSPMMEPLVKNSRILAAILCLVITIMAAPALAEDYPGADLQQADQLEAQASEAIESGRQRHADTRTAEFLFQKAQYEVSARHGQEAKRYFLMAIDAMRPASDAVAPDVAQGAAGGLQTPPAQVAPALAADRVAPASAGDGEAAGSPASETASSATSPPAPKRHHRRHARRHRHHHSHNK
jgi:hypothetical protein